MNPELNFLNEEELEAIVQRMERDLDAAEEQEVEKKKLRSKKRQVANPKQGFRCSIRTKLPF